ncbi:MAG: amidohydrolase family protein [Candidatus Dadabacteria bacterium]|nr:amidohydrolase family protein [Candidatus Dadabacteria bacterium]NIQ15908.1 amidohydrolase family protein [Candidatus Dadabacteria bacterium]
MNEALKKYKVFDSHFHIIDNQFPLVSNQGFIPEEFTCDDYLERMRPYNLIGGAIVSGSFQGFDNSYLVKALDRLGDKFAGVLQLPESVTDDDILYLDKIGVRGVRFNLKRGGSQQLDYLKSMAQRVYELLDWHIEIYADSMKLSQLYDVIISLPSVSIDHLGITHDHFNTVLKLAEKGVRVKASGFGRVDFNVKAALKDIYSANPDSLMFGTDHPSTRAPRPYKEDDINLILETFDFESAQKIFCKNAVEFYKIK